jgi:stage V sporulation protein B
MIFKGLEDIKTFYWGVFSGKYRVLINIPIALASAMSASTIPTLVNHIENKNYTQVKSKIQNVIRVTMIIAIPCAVGLGVLAKPIIDMLFSGEIDMAAKMLHLGAITIVFYSFSTLTNGILQGINHMRIPVRNSFISLFVEMIFLYMILKYTNIGIFGVVFANILFSSLMCVLNLLAIRKYLHYKQELFKTFVIPIISSIIMGILVFIIYKVFSLFTGNILITVVGVVVGVGTYFFLMIFFKGIGIRELQIMPFGNRAISVLKKMHLLKNEDL